jgi:hypothetical protein
MNQPEQKGRVLAFHHNQTVERYTPPEITAKAQELLNPDCLDVASCETANYLHRFPRFLTKEDESENQEWNATSVFLNPPGDMRNWWDLLINKWENNEFRDAIFVGFSLSIVAQRHETISRFPHWIPRQRIKYWSWLKDCPECGKVSLGSDRHCKRCDYPIANIIPELRPATSPPHHSIIVYVPPQDPLQWAVKTIKFGDIFGDRATNPPILFDCGGNRISCD